MNITLRQNTVSRAISQYSNFFFDRGVINIAGRKIALNCNELVELTGSTDKGSEISARFQTGAIAYGDGEKRVRSIHVKGQFDDKNSINVKYALGGIDPDFTTEKPMTTRLGTGNFGALKFSGVRSKHGEHLSVLVENVTGKFFYITGIVSFLIHGCRR